MVLPKSEKDRIAASKSSSCSQSMIMQGIEYHKILERVRETSGRNRTSILEKDIENIIAAYGLSVNQSRHSDDSTSVCLIAQDMKDAGELLYFKDQGELDPQNTEIPSEEFVLAFMKEGQQLMFSEQLKNTEKLQNKSHPSKPKSPTEEIEMIQDIVCKEDSTRSQVEEQITEVKMKLQSLLSECDEMKDLESVKSLNNHLSKAYGIVHAGRTYPAQSNNLPVDTSTVLEPSNKNVVKQDRLHSTKKRKQKDEGKSLKKPSVRARQEIVESLAKSQSDISFPILSTGAICDEHSYC
ncbi:hypothetical protein Pcinc_000539 [Petrolisthes cinctipes]|uniref:Uncharacterized protein n=1 Tax=Petrolisthes cinctipes TaxID=88211 RepID=A0AAE1GPA3_PETCI|nr:hypothetical protein Pcinc_000539 [Petrolisthes cinctipes]